MIHVDMSYYPMPKPRKIITTYQTNLMLFEIGLFIVKHSWLKTILKPLSHSWFMLDELCFSPSMYNTNSMEVVRELPILPTPRIIPLLLSL